MQQYQTSDGKICSRREFMQLIAAATTSIVLQSCVPSIFPQSPEPTAKVKTPQTEPVPEFPAKMPNAKEALLQLTVGNLRYSENLRKSPHQTLERRKELANLGQHPIAAVLCCSDSRVPPEIVFDQGLGDLFIVRVAGNVASFDDVRASLDYAVEHLEVPLVMVLGHQRCGAITSALQGKKIPGDLGELMAALHPAVEAAKKQPGDPVDNAVRANIRLTIQELVSKSEIISTALKEGKIEVVGAYYSLESGKVELL
jgi:carbonic anhydrase